MSDQKQSGAMNKIDAYLEQFARGMLELKASQDRTDAQLRMTDAQIKELKVSQDRTDAQLRMTDAQIKELKVSQDRTDAQLAKTIKKLDEIGRQLGDLGLVQGEVAEELFYRNVKGVFSGTDIPVERVRRNVKVKGSGEYDIVVDGKGRVLVIEVKNKLDRRMVDTFLEKKLARFKTLLPEYRERKVYGGIGALVVKDDVGRYAEKAGLFVLTQTDDGGAALLNRKGFKPKEFS
jgi:hypothetical protein